MRRMNESLCSRVLFRGRGKGMIERKDRKE